MDVAGTRPLLILEGSVAIEIAGGPTLELKVGDMASPPKGAVTTWYVTTPFKEIWFFARPYDEDPALGSRRGRIVDAMSSMVPRGPARQAHGGGMFLSGTNLRHSCMLVPEKWRILQEQRHDHARIFEMCACEERWGA